MKNLVLLLITIFTMTSLKAESLVGKVVSIHDGDTLTFIIQGETKKSKLRLLGVDTPEVDFNGQSQGEVALRALNFFKSLLPLNSIITVELPKSGGTDANGRYLGQVFYQGEDLNLKMLENGWGAMYFIYPYDKKLLVNYMNATKAASDNGLGIFSDAYKSQLLPYMFRQRSKGTPGTNLVANFETKKLYSAEDIEEIPHFARVFFSSEDTALIHGFNW